MTALKKQGTIKKTFKKTTSWTEGGGSGEEKTIVWTSPPPTHTHTNPLRFVKTAHWGKTFGLSISLLAMLQKHLCPYVQFKPLHLIFFLNFFWKDINPSSDLKLKTHHNTQELLNRLLCIIFVEGSSLLGQFNISPRPQFKGISFNYSSVLLSVRKLCKDRTHRLSMQTHTKMSRKSNRSKVIWSMLLKM